MSITSSESGAVRGAGHTAPDVAGAEIGADDRQFQLRAERSGRGAGRIYTVQYRATDRAGNSTDATAHVVVPHDRSARESAPGGRERR